MGGSRLDRKIKEYEQGINEIDNKTERREQLKVEFYNYDKMLREIKKEQRNRPIKFRNREFWENKINTLLSLMNGVMQETIFCDKQLAWHMKNRLKQRKIEFHSKKEIISNDSKIDNGKEEQDEWER